MSERRTLDVKECWSFADVVLGGDLYLELVLPCFSGGRGVEEIDCEDLRLC